MCDNCVELQRQRDDALKVRDLARSASNRDLEAKRAAEGEVLRLRKLLTTPTLLHGVPFEYDPTPYGPGEHKVIARTTSLH